MVSVIIPVYNSKKYLKPCLDSIAAQSYPDREIIIIDDGSTDGSADICRAFANDNPATKVIHRPNGGLSCARNTGLDYAQGDYITFIDADDIISATYLQELMDAAKDTRADIVAGLMVEFTGKAPEALVKAPGSTPRIEKITPVDALLSILYQEDTQRLNCSACGKLYHASLLRKLRFTPEIGYEDLDIIDRLTLSAKTMVTTTGAIYFYRKHPESFIHSSSPMRTDVVGVTRRLTKRLAGRTDGLTEAARSRELSACFNILTLISAGCKLPDGQATARRCYKRIKALRRRCLRDPRVRARNKAAIIASYIGGRPLLTLLAKLFIRHNKRGARRV